MIIFPEHLYGDPSKAVLNRCRRINKHLSLTKPTQCLLKRECRLLRRSRERQMWALVGITLTWPINLWTSLIITQVINHQNNFFWQVSLVKITEQVILKLAAKKKTLAIGLIQLYQIMMIWLTTKKWILMKLAKMSLQKIKPAKCQSKIVDTKWLLLQ